MRVLGKVAFAPVIASSMIAAGAGAGVAMAASMPTAHGNTVTPNSTFSRTVSKPTVEISSTITGGTGIGLAHYGDHLVCTSAKSSQATGKVYYHCTDSLAGSKGVTGWIPASATS